MKGKEKVVNEEEEVSLEDTELESDDDEEESLEVTKLESEPVMEPQLPPSLWSAPQLSPPPSPPLFTSALGFEKGNEATILFMESPNQSVRKREIPLFDNHIPPLPPPPPYPPLPPLSPPPMRLEITGGNMKRCFTMGEELLTKDKKNRGGRSPQPSAGEKKMDPYRRNRKEEGNPPWQSSNVEDDGEP